MLRRNTKDTPGDCFFFFFIALKTQAVSRPSNSCTSLTLIISIVLVSRWLLYKWPSMTTPYRSTWNECVPHFLLMTLFARHAFPKILLFYNFWCPPSFLSTITCHSQMLLFPPASCHLRTTKITKVSSSVSQRKRFYSLHMPRLGLGVAVSESRGF